MTGATRRRRCRAYLTPLCSSFMSTNEKPRSTMTMDGKAIMRISSHNNISNNSSNNNNNNNRILFSSLSKQAATQSADFSPKNRWLAVPPANLVHLSIGGVYVYLMWTPAMTQTLGVVSSAPLDWTHSQVLPVFSCAAISLGLTTHYLGKIIYHII
ncbi:MAG: hypothetical protein ACI90V_012781 [Bacillariaceae sp.]|jgi:hypothetical protein